MVKLHTFCFCFKTKQSNIEQKPNVTETAKIPKIDLCVGTRGEGNLHELRQIMQSVPSESGGGGGGGENEG